MSEIKDSIALGDKDTVKVHQGLCMYLKYLSEKEGKKVELKISQEGLFNHISVEEYNKQKNASTL